MIRTRPAGQPMPPPKSRANAVAEALAVAERDALAHPAPNGSARQERAPERPQERPQKPAPHPAAGGMDFSQALRAVAGRQAHRTARRGAGEETPDARRARALPTQGGLSAAAPESHARSRRPHHPTAGLHAARVPRRNRRAGCGHRAPMDDRSREARDAPQSGGARRSAGAGRRTPRTAVDRARREGARRRPVFGGRRAASRPGSSRCLHDRDGGALRPVEEHAPRGLLCIAGRPLHAVRGAGVPHHHVLPRPSGCDGHLHGGNARFPPGVSPPAGQRKPRLVGRGERRPSQRHLDGPLSEALLPLRDGGGEA